MHDVLLHGMSGLMFDLTRSCLSENPPSSRASVLKFSGARVLPSVDFTELSNFSPMVAGSVMVLLYPNLLNQLVLVDGIPPASDFWFSLSCLVR